MAPERSSKTGKYVHDIQKYLAKKWKKCNYAKVYKKMQPAVVKCDSVWRGWIALVSMSQKEDKYTGNCQGQNYKKTHSAY